MGFPNGAGFRVAGNVTRRFVSQSGKFAALTIDVNRHPRSVKVEMRCFDLGIIGEIEKLSSGQSVEASGQVDVEVLKAKSGEEISIDGYKKWVPVLTIKALKTEADVAGPPRAAEPAPPSEHGRREEPTRRESAGYGSRRSAFSSGSGSGRRF